MNKDTFIPSALNWHIKDDRAWFVAEDSNALMEINLKNNKLKYLDTISKTIFRSNRTCFFYQDSLYCLPDTAQRIWVYNLKTGSRRDIFLQELDGKRSNINDYWYLKESQELLLFLYEQHSFIRFSLAAEKTTKTALLSEDMINMGITRFKNNIYLISLISDKVYQYDILSNKVNEYATNCGEDGFYAICANDKSIWLAGKEHFLYRFTIGENKCQSIPLPKNYGKKNDKMKQRQEDADPDRLGIFNKAIFLNDCVWLLPTFEDYPLCFDTLKNEWFKIELPNENESFEAIDSRDANIKYWFLYEKDNRYFGLYSYKNEWVVEIDSFNKTWKILEFDTDDVQWEKALNYEKTKKTFELWFDSFLKTDASSDNAKVSKDSASKKIYELIKAGI